jgi:DNA-damage-inducible protein D
MTENKVVIFQEKNVRRVWHDDKWWFAVADIIEVLTESSDVKQYIKKLRSRDPELAANWGTICTPLRMEALDGKMREVNAANTEGIFRIIMSVPSPKAEPFKKWLAKVGQERIEEIENPEIGVERIRELYRAKGYSDEWIETRMKSIDIRRQLTDEWKARGVKENIEYSILTAEISKATFGLSPSEYKNLKGLQRENLRDHMTNLELIFTMLGEEATRQIAVDKDAQGFPENHDAAQLGGKSAGSARKNFEKTSGKKVISAQNFKHLKEGDKMLELPTDDLG